MRHLCKCHSVCRFLKMCVPIRKPQLRKFRASPSSCSVTQSGSQPVSQSASEPVIVIYPLSAVVGKSKVPHLFENLINLLCFTFHHLRRFPYWCRRLFDSARVLHLMLSFSALCFNANIHFIFYVYISHL